MAFTSQQGRTSTSLSEINVTPLVDVMLVLLVIFMVTAPILTTGIDVELPVTKNVATKNAQQKIVISISHEGLIYYGSEPIDFTAIPEQLKSGIGSGQDQIFLRADKDVRWNTIVSVMDVIRGSGYEKIQLVTKEFQLPRTK